MAPERAAEELRFDVGWGRLAALHWKTAAPSSHRLLAVHGWLDNAASFAGLAAALPDCEILALDLAGHGHSDWRGAGASYALPEHLADIAQVLDALDWQDCIAIGHSMGGAIASLLAVAAPERVRALVSIDALGPLSLPEDDVPARLQRALRARFEPSPRRRLFDSIAAACEQRARLNNLSPALALPLVERALRQEGLGWIWAADPRLQLPSAVPMSEAQVQAVLRAIRQPCLVLAAEIPDPKLPRLSVEPRLACLPHAEAKRLPGGHHLHIAEAARVAGAIIDFIERLPTARAKATADALPV